MANPITLEAAQAAGYNLINGQTETLIIAIFFALIVLLLAALREMHNRGVIADNLREELKTRESDKARLILLVATMCFDKFDTAFVLEIANIWPEVGKQYINLSKAGKENG